jgi:hypothetical protein
LEAPSVELVALESRVQETAVASGEAVVYEVDGTVGPDWTLDYEVTLPEGLTASTEVDGVDRTLVVAGPDGSYELPAVSGVATHTDGTVRELVTSPIFVDIGVVGPSSQLSGVQSASRPEPPVWPKVAGAVALGLALLGAAAMLWRRFKPKAPPVPSTPPHILALREWNSARMRLRGDDHALAVALSGIFRQYTESVTHVKATALTTSEILEDLPRHWDRERCKRLLTATDLIKFARAEGGRSLFDELDRDLKATLGAGDA